MNHAARVINKVRISRGGIDQTTADVRSILREALLQRATQIALIHNHPSGNPQPSMEDQKLTQFVQKGAQTIYTAFQQSAQQWPDHDFMLVLPETADAYDIPAGAISYAQAQQEIDRLAALYSAAGYGHGHRRYSLHFIVVTRRG